MTDVLLDVVAMIKCILKEWSPTVTLQVENWIPVNEEERKTWIHVVSKAREAFDHPKNLKVCSNHFIDGKPTQSNPDPTLFLTISTNTLPTPNKERPPPKPRLLNIKPPKEKKRLKYVASEQIVASSTVAENKSTNFDNFSSPNSSIMVAGLSSPEFDTEFKKISDVNFLMTLILVQA